VTQEEVVGRVIDALERLGVVYMVAGSFASNFHGVPRMTQDADLVVALDEPGVPILVRELETDFYVSEEAAREAVRLKRLFNAIHLATGFKVDLVIKKDRPFSDEELARRTTLFGVRVPRGCRSYAPDQRFWIAGTARGRYSDGSIICGKPEHPSHDRQATTNPSVIVEVLSPSGEGDDEGEKRRDFQSLASLQAYVIAAQDARHVKVYRRNERGEWGDEPYVYRNGESFELPTLTRAIAVDEVYDDILDAGGRSLLR
jgi:Uma2 family endonuclease